MALPWPNVRAGGTYASIQGIAVVQVGGNKRMDDFIKFSKRFKKIA